MSFFLSSALLVFIFWSLYKIIGLIFRFIRRLIPYYRAFDNHSGRLIHKIKPAMTAQAMILAHPFEQARIGHGFYDLHITKVTPELLRLLRQPLLEYFGLRYLEKDEEICLALSKQLATKWFRIDLDHLGQHDNARDIIAFACARMAFAIRLANLFGWLSMQEQAHYLHCNGLRARDCFTSWEDYGKALARGRKQWIVNGRADALGQAFTENEVMKWLAEPYHPWKKIPWDIRK